MLLTNFQTSLSGVAAAKCADKPQRCKKAFTRTGWSFLGFDITTVITAYASFLIACALRRRPRIVACELFSGAGAHVMSFTHRFMRLGMTMLLKGCETDRRSKPFHVRNVHARV